MLCHRFYFRTVQLFLNSNDLNLNIVKILVMCMSFVSVIYELNIELSLFVSLKNPKWYLFFCKVVKIFNKITHWFWYSWLDNSIPLFNPDPPFLHPSYCHFTVSFDEIKCCGKWVQFLCGTASCYSWEKFGILPSCGSPPTQPVWHKEPHWGGEQRKCRK